MKPIMIMPDSKFLKVACKKCKKEQVIFSKPSTQVNCLKCGEVLAINTGGDSILQGKLLATY